MANTDDAWSVQQLNDPAPWLDPIDKNLAQLTNSANTLISVIEAGANVIKLYLISLPTPYKIAVLLFIAKIRAIINNFASSGFYFLPMLPNTNASSVTQAMNSISGGYSGFKSRLTQKFFDESDPQAPRLNGNNVTAYIGYVGSADLSALIRLIDDILTVIGKDYKFYDLPAPVNFKVKAGISKASELFSADDIYFNSLDISTLWRDSANYSYDIFHLSWEMPNTNPKNPKTSFFSPFESVADTVFPKTFIIEVSSSSDGQGVFIPGKEINSDKTGLAQVDVRLKEEGGAPYFYGAYYDYLSGSFLGSELISDVKFTYNIKKDDIKRHLSSRNLTWNENSPLYFRVRAASVKSALGGDTYDTRVLKKQNSNLLEDNSYNDHKVAKADAKNYTINTQGEWKSKDNVQKLYPPSNVVKAWLPSTTLSDFKVYDTIYCSLLLGFAFEFEVPNFGEFTLLPGFGTLRKFGPSVSAFKTLNSNIKDFGRILSGSGAVYGTITCAWLRKTTHEISSNVLKNPSWMLALRDSYRSNGIAEILKLYVEDAEDINTDFSWANYVLREDKFKTQKYAVPWEVRTSSADQRNRAILRLNQVYGKVDYAGTATERKQLASFLNLVMNSSGSGSAHLSWYSITIGEILPLLPDLLNRLSRLIESFFRAFDNIVAYIDEVVKNAKKKINQYVEIMNVIRNLVYIIKMALQWQVATLTVKANGVTTKELMDRINEAKNSPGDNESDALKNGYSIGYVMLMASPKLDIIDLVLQK